MNYKGNMKRIPAIISLVFCLYLPSALSAQDESDSSAVIFNFSTSGASADSEYYSFIIPDALARQMEETHGIQAARSMTELHQGVAVENIDQEILKTAAADEKAETVITGTIVLSEIPSNAIPDKKKIRIKPGRKKKPLLTQADPKQQMTLTVLVYDAVLDKKLLVSTEPFIAGALLQDAIDAISRETAARLALFDEEKKALALKEQQEAEADTTEEKPAEGPSPYLSLFSALSGISFGMDAGKLFLLGSYGNDYKDTQIISPWINYPLSGLVPGLGLSVGMNYFTSASKPATAASYFLLQCWSAMAGTSYRLQVNGWFAPEVSVSGGVTRTIIDVYPVSSSDMPFTKFTSKDKSFDPCLDISAALRFSLAPVHVRTGVLFKRVFNSDRAINALSLFAGFALSF